MADQPVARAELAEALASQKTELLDSMAALEQRIVGKTQEAVRDAQTGILKAFLPFQESMSNR